MIVKRRFADIAEGQIHYREAGQGGVPLVMLHASPTSSKSLEALIAAMGETRRTIAPDTRGNGDSTPLPMAQPEIPDLARATIEFLDVMGLDRIDLFGTHTGASTAMEIAIAQPQRVRRLILGGMGLYTPEDQKEYLDVYAPDVRPDLNGGHINWAWHFCRDMQLFWPWFKRDAEHRRPLGLPTAEGLHDIVVEVLKSITTFNLSYRAAFRHPKRTRLPLLTVPTLMTVAEGDMLAPHLDEMVSLVPGSRQIITPPYGTPEGAAATAKIYAAFLDG